MYILHLIYRLFIYIRPENRKKNETTMNLGYAHSIEIY